MKKFITLKIAALCVAILSTLTCAAQERVFNSLPKMEGVTNVFVGKQMLQLAQTCGFEKTIGDMDLDLNGVENVEVVTSENAESTKNLTAKADAIIKNLNLTVVSDIVDDEGEQVTIYFLASPTDPDYTSTVVIRVVDKEEVTYVSLTGNININKLVTD